MPPTVVLVTFYSRRGATEKLAHAAAVGAVQGRAAIRLRRIPDVGADAALERFPESGAELERMRKEYVAPREADVLAADALIFGSPADVDAASPEWASYMELLGRLQADGKLAGKVGVAIPNGPAFDSFASAIRRLGLRALTADGSGAAGTDDVTRAVALGREVVSAVQERKTT